jgi:hypothetical protein
MLFSQSTTELQFHIIILAPFLSRAVVHLDVVKAENASQDKIPGRGIAANTTVDNNLAVAAAHAIADLATELSKQFEGLSSCHPGSRHTWRGG